MSNNTTFEKRHRPTCFDDLIFADPLIKNGLRRYATRAQYGCILLHGPFGTAKSTTAEIIIRERHNLIGVTQGHIERLTAVSLKSSGLEVLENALGLMITANANDGQPYVIIDEVDLLSKTMQNELRHLIDTKSVAKFIMTTNDLCKVDKGIRNRSDEFHLAPLTAQHLLGRAEAIVEAEGVSIPQDLLLRLLNNTNDVRAMLRDLEGLVLTMKESLSPPPLPPTKGPKIRVLNGGSPPSS